MFLGSFAIVTFLTFILISLKPLEFEVMYMESSDEVFELVKNANHVQTISIANSNKDVFLQEDSKHFNVEHIIFEDKNSPKGLLVLEEFSSGQLRYFVIHKNDPIINLLNETQKKDVYVYEGEEGNFLDVLSSNKRAYY